MKFSHILITIFFVGFASIAEAGLPFTSKTISWNEEVLLAEGQKISIQRTVTYGVLVNDTHLFGERGGGPAEKQTIRFFYKGHQIEWKYSHPSWQYSMPDILDFVEGMPVLVLPVYYWEPCDKYNFPREGLVAFGYRNGHWDRIAIADLPKNLRINLLSNTHDLRYGDRYKGKLITVQLKQQFSKNSWVPSQGQSIEEASKFYSSVKESCARIHPLPNPQQEAAKKQNAESELNPLTLVATLKSSSNSPKEYSSDDYFKTHGKWSGDFYITESCSGIVEGSEPTRQYREGGGWRLIGCTLIMKNGIRIPFQDFNTKQKRISGSIQLVTCDKNLIYAVKHPTRDKIIAYRFFNDGSLKDTLEITLLDIDKYFSKETWPIVWEVLIEKEQMTITMVSYSYTRSANLGGILKQQLIYTVALKKDGANP